MAKLTRMAGVLETSATRARTGRPVLVGPDGEQIPLPEPVFQVLREAVRYLAAGDGVTIVPYQHELTTQQAADLLNVSRPYLVRLLEQGDLPYTKTGTHRRIRFNDLMAYKEERDRRRRASLRRLTQKSQRLGLYGKEAASAP